MVNEPGHPLKVAMAAKGISNREMAEAMGCSVPMVSHYRNGLRPSPARRKVAADLTDTPQEDLWPDLPVAA